MIETWTEHRERGSAALIRIIAFLTLRVGRSVGRALLYPICTYFLVSSPRARRASMQYLCAARNRPSTLIDAFRHFHVHANVLLDRLFVMTSGTQSFTLNIHGEELMDDLKRRKQGCVLLGAHLGSFDVLRSLADESAVDVRVLMYLKSSKKLNQVLESLNPSFRDLIIPLGEPTSLVTVGKHVQKGGMVAILGDRLVGGDRAIEVPFFGNSANFPVGPLMLAAALKVPVILFVGLRMGDRVYDIHFEHFSDPMTEGARGLADDDIRAWIGRYAQRVEHYCRKSPYNWFNFYDFWQK